MFMSRPGAHTNRTVCADAIEGECCSGYGVRDRPQALLPEFGAVMAGGSSGRYHVTPWTEATGSLDTIYSDAVAPNHLAPASTYWFGQGDLAQGGFG